MGEQYSTDDTHGTDRKKKHNFNLYVRNRNGLFKQPLYIIVHHRRDDAADFAYDKILITTENGQTTRVIANVAPAALWSTTVLPICIVFSFYVVRRVSFVYLEIFIQYQRAGQKQQTVGEICGIELCNCAVSIWQRFG